MFKKIFLGAVVAFAGNGMMAESADAGGPFYRGRSVIVGPTFRPPVVKYRAPVYRYRSVYRPPVYRSFYGGGVYGRPGFYGRSSYYGRPGFYGGSPYYGRGFNRGGVSVFFGF